MTPDDRPIMTSRLILDPFRETDVTTDYLGWLNDRKVMRFSEQRFRSHSQESCQSYVRSFAGTPNQFLAIRDRVSGEAVGTATLYVEPEQRRGDIGILLGSPAHRGRGLGLEAWIGLLDFALHRRGLRKVAAGTLAVNEPMIRIMRRSGMAEDGRRARHVVWEDKEVDVVHAAAFAGEWSAPRDVGSGS
jgi:RimJ/RimL family protein N-acetyltransferase